MVGEIKQGNIQKYLDGYVSHKRRTEIAEKVWYKLYLLMYYKVTPDMFVGTQYRWKTILVYQNLIRNIYKNPAQDMSKYQKTLVDYIQGLIDSGVEPYPDFSNEFGQKVLYVGFLQEQGLLTKYEIDQIYSHITSFCNKPDFTKRNDRRYFGKIQTDKIHGNYTELTINPINTILHSPVTDKHVTAPFGKVGKNFYETIKSIFSLPLS